MSVKQGEIITCQYCGKNRVRYVKKKNICQVCYREMLDRYCLYEYRDEKENMTECQREICKCVIEDGILDTKEIQRKTGYSLIQIQITIRNKLKHVDSEGNERPF
nr:MAG TPA: Protein of unknown function (DUF2089) [Caudoviricetes sp.]